jgi:hypothetical protein
MKQRMREFSETVRVLVHLIDSPDLVFGDFERAVVLSLSQKTHPADQCVQGGDLGPPMSRLDADLCVFGVALYEHK